MKKTLALAIALVLTMSVICVPCPGALAAPDPDDYISVWYSLRETEDGTFVNVEGSVNRPTLVLNSDYTAYWYYNDEADPGITPWGMGTGAYGTPVGRIWILDTGGWRLYSLLAG